MSPESPEYQADRSVRYAQWLIQWRWAVLAVSLIVAVGMISGGQFLRMETAYRVFFGKDNPQLKAFDEVQNIYTKNDNILFVVAPDDGEVFTRQTLAAVEALTAESWKLPYAIRVDAVTNFQHTRAEGDDLIVADLIESAATRTDEEIAYAKAIAIKDPRLVNFVIPEKANVTGVNVTLQLPEKDPRENEIVAAAARALGDRLESEHPNVQVYLTGFAMLNNAFQESSMKDMATLTPLMYLIIFLTMGFLLRSATGTLTTGVIIVLSTGAGMGLAGWLNIPITPPSSAAPTVIMTLAVADSIHILVTMLQQMRQGLDKRGAIVESLRLNLQPVFLTSLTTVVGFLSMNFSDVPPLRDLGNITAMGVTAAFLFSVSMLPALMAVLPVRVKQQSTSQTVLVDRFADWVVGQRRPLLWGSLALVVGLGTFVPNNDLNDQFVKYFDESISFRTDTDFAMKHLSGIYQIEYSIEAERSQGISDPVYLERIDAFSDWFRQQHGVVHVNNLSETMKRLNMNMHGDDPAHMRLPENPELSAQYLLLYEMSLPYGLDLNNQINVDKSATRVVVTAENVTTRDLRLLVEGGEAWLRENAPTSMHATGVGPAVMFSYISERNIRSMLIGTLLAFFIISGVLMIALRSVKFGLLSIIPNVAPALLSFGVWGILVSQVNLGLSVVVGMTLGIVVDDTVHYLSKYLRARREQGLDSEGAVRYAFSSVGTALIVTSLILVAGFAVLSQSSFGFNAGMGQMTALTVAFALVADFTLLPAVLMALEGKKETVEVEDEDTDYDDDMGVLPETA
jgi:uncharacterized protein